MRPISPRIHGTLDYLTVAFLAAVPLLFRLPRWAKAASVELAGAQLAGSLATNYPLGAARRLDFGTHGALEVLIGVGLLAAPLLPAVRRDATTRNLCLALGAIYVTVPLLTDYDRAAAGAEKAEG